MPRARWQVNVLTLQFGLNHTCMLLYVLFLLELDEYVLRGAEIVSVLSFFCVFSIWCCQMVLPQNYFDISIVVLSCCQF
jgi:hypothetical protein